MKAIDLERALKPYGLHSRGLFALTDNDSATLTQPISMLAGKNNLAIALVGNIGSSFWPQFASAPEYNDGMPDPLDRWSKRVAAQLAKELDISPLFPSDGPPYFPFQQWATRAEGLSPCVSCIDQPCLNTCPVQAITASGYDVPKCAEYLKLDTSSDCNQKGCQARLSCPAGAEYRYADAQHLFHVRAFVNARD
jgi:epoxyqueuosine reductase